MSYSMLDDAVFFIVTFVVTAAYAYAAYWGYAIARRFVVRAYRYQALGIASISAYLGLVNLIGTFSYSGLTSSSLLVIITALANLAGIPLILLWVDSTARVARRSDPFEKDTLRWSRLRYVVFAAVLVTCVPAVVFAPIVPATLSYVSGVSSLLNFIGVFPFFATVATGAAVLALSARRSRDRMLRRHIVWFAGFCGSLVLYFAVLVALSIVNPTGVSDIEWLTLTTPPFLLGAYLLYRSARSLAPYTSSLEASPGQAAKASGQSAP